METPHEESLLCHTVLADMPTNTSNLCGMVRVDVTG